MVGIAHSIELDSVVAQGALRDLTAWDLDALAFNVGALLESSTQERIATGKAAPDGTPWVPWSEAYDDTREARHSLLVSEGYLLSSIQNYTTGPEIVVGTNLVYGAVHQEGSEEGSDQNIPARPYLGVSDEDADDITDLVSGDLSEILQ